MDFYLFLVTHSPKCAVRKLILGLAAMIDAFELTEFWRITANY